MSKKETLILEGLENRYGTEAVIAAINNAQEQMDTCSDEECGNVEAVTIIDYKEAILGFIKFLEGCHTRINEIHWEADHNSKHELADDVHDNICEYEDKIAENMMGFLGTRIKVFEITPQLPKATNLKELLDEMESWTLTLIASVEAEKKCTGLVNILEDMIEYIDKCKYLETMQ